MKSALLVGAMLLLTSCFNLQQGVILNSTGPAPCRVQVQTGDSLFWARDPHCRTYRLYAPGDTITFYLKEPKR